MATRAGITLTGPQRTFESPKYLALPGGASLWQLHENIEDVLTEALGA